MGQFYLTPILLLSLAAVLWLAWRQHSLLYRVRATFPETLYSRTHRRNALWARDSAIHHGLALLLLPTGLAAALLSATPSAVAGLALLLGVALTETLRRVIRHPANWTQALKAAPGSTPVLLTLPMWAAALLAGGAGAWAVWGGAVLIAHLILAGPRRARGTRRANDLLAADNALAWVLARGALTAHQLRLRPTAGSSDTPMNACAAGMGRWARVVVDEPLHRHLPPNLLRAVVAHETGHLLRRHHLRFYGLGVGAALPAFLLLETIIAPADPAGWALLVWTWLALYPVLQFWCAPATNHLRRLMELEADQEGAKMVGRATLSRALETLDRITGGQPPFDRYASVFLRNYPTLATRRRHLTGNAQHHARNRH